jgi:hypothetical protein
MSGKKRISVDEDVWRVAQEAAQRLASVQREMPGMLDAVRRAHEAQAARTAAEMRARHEQLAQALAGLSEEARLREERTSRRIAETTRAILAEVDAAEQRAQAQTDALDQRLSAEIAMEREERRRDFEALRADLDELHADKQRSAEAAATAIADARLLHDAIATGLPHERFARGRLADIERLLTTAQLDAARGDSQAALSTARNVDQQLGQLRVEVEFKDAQWRAAHLRALDSVTRLLQQIQGNARIDVGDDEEPAELDVDFWSNGRLTALREDAEVLLSRVNETTQPLSQLELERIAEHDVPGLEERLSGIVTNAIARQYVSQARVNLAETVVGALEETAGYVWHDGDATYAGDDQREAFYAKLRNPVNEGDEIVVEVSPDAEGKANVLRILSYEASPDENGRRRRAEALARSLRDRGLHIGDVTDEGGEPEPIDFAELRKPVPASQREMSRARAGRS